MQSKIRFLYNANGNLAQVITQETVQGEEGLISAAAPENKLYAGQVGTIEYYLSVAQENAWLNTDLVFMTFGRSDGKVAQRLMHYDNTEKAWTLVSNGWETDVEVAAGSSANLVVSFVHKRYSTLSPNRVSIDTTTQAVTLPVYPSAGYTPLNIENDVAADILEYCATIQALREEVYGDGSEESRIDLNEEAIAALAAETLALEAGLIRREYVKQADKTYVWFNASECSNALHLATGTLLHNYATAGVRVIAIASGENTFTVDWADGSEVSAVSSAFAGFAVSDATGKAKYLAVYVGTNCPVGNYSFHGCNNLKSVEFAPGWVYTSIGGFAFYNCTSLASVFIPDSVTTITEEAFRGCTALMTISLPNGLTTIETELFRDCEKLITVALPYGITDVKSGAFRSCQSLMRIMLPSSITTIGANAFKGCASLTTLIISVGITSIGAYAFDATGLKKITFVNNSTLPTIGTDAFYGQRNLEVVCRTESLLNSAITAVTAAGGLVLCGVYDGVRTYIASPKVPTPAGDTDAANKKFVEDKVGEVHTHSNKAVLDATTKPFTTELKEQYDTAAAAAAAVENKVDKIAGKGLSENDLTDELKSAYDGAVSSLANKVDKVSGKGLSTNDYTTAEKNKLAGLESSHFKGRFTSNAALLAAFPTGAAGDYAQVDIGEDMPTSIYIWDVTDAEWQLQEGTSAELTPAQVKTLYESNEDTNAYTDAEKVKLGGLDAALSGKVDKVTGKGLSTEDYTSEEKAKLSGLPTSAEPFFIKKTAFNKNFGTEADTVCQGNDSRLVKRYDSFSAINESFDSSTSLITVIQAMDGNSTLREYVSAGTVYPEEGDLVIEKHAWYAVLHLYGTTIIGSTGALEAPEYVCHARSYGNGTEIVTEITPWQLVPRSATCKSGTTVITGEMWYKFATINIKNTGSGKTKYDALLSIHYPDCSGILSLHLEFSNYTLSTTKSFWEIITPTSGLSSDDYKINYTALYECVTLYCRNPFQVARQYNINLITESTISARNLKMIMISDASAEAYEPVGSIAVKRPSMEYGNVLTDNLDTLGTRTCFFTCTRGATGAPDAFSAWSGYQIVNDEDPRQVLQVAFQIGFTPYEMRRTKIGTHWYAWENPFPSILIKTSGIRMEMEGAEINLGVCQWMGGIDPCTQLISFDGMSAPLPFALIMLCTNHQTFTLTESEMDMLFTHKIVGINISSSQMQVPNGTAANFRVNGLVAANQTLSFTLAVGEGDLMLLSVKRTSTTTADVVKSVDLSSGGGDGQGEKEGLAYIITPDSENEGETISEPVIYRYVGDDPGQDIAPFDGGTAPLFVALMIAGFNGETEFPAMTIAEFKRLANLRMYCILQGMPMLFDGVAYFAGEVEHYVQYSFKDDRDRLYMVFSYVDDETPIGVNFRLESKGFDQTVNIDPNDWNEDNGKYVKTVACDDITGDDNPIIDVKTNSDFAQTEAILQNWGKIYHIETNIDQLTLYASEPTTESFQILVKVVR